MEITISPIATLLLVGIATATAFLAHRNYRNIYLWFFLGMIFGIMALIALFFLTSKTRKIKTRPQQNTKPSFKPEKFWYFLDAENKQFGPMSFPALKQELKENNLDDSTFVWNEDFSNWKRIRELTNAQEFTLQN